MMAKYVQHISGQGKKYRVVGSDHDYDLWLAEANPMFASNLRLPKSEYHEVPGPEEWEDVTDKIEIYEPQVFSSKSGLGPGRVTYQGDLLANLVCGGLYRLRKVQLLECKGLNTSPEDYHESWAFKVERRKDVS